LLLQSKSAWLKTKAEPPRLGQFVYAQNLSGPASGDQVKNQRNYSENDQKMDKPASDVEREKTACPENH
jgi:hypothetical protein